MMDAFATASAKATAGLSEVLDNLKIRESFTAFFVANAGRLYNYSVFDRDLKREHAAILALKTADAAPVYRGLYLETHSIFEEYISDISSACLTSHANSASKYSDIPEETRNAHSVSSAKILSRYFEGGINGVPYAFPQLMDNLGTCFANDRAPALNTDVLTVTLGNRTPDRLDTLFGKLGLAAPFDIDAGKNAKLKAFAGGGSAKDVSEFARDALDESIRIRNKIVHQPSSAPPIAPNDVRQLADLFASLVLVFEGKCRTRFP